MKAKTFFFFLILINTILGQEFTKVIPLLENEKWWGGAVVDAPLMPMSSEKYELDLYGNTFGNQAQPLFISNYGRYIWCEAPVKVVLKNDTIRVIYTLSQVYSGKSGNTLKEAFLYVTEKFSPPKRTIPDPLLFTKPQYNTWIELMYDQTQENILKYAHDIVDNGFPAGVLMIDDNWQEDYGVWEFKAEVFADPKSMIKELHDLGFKVMVWVCPFVSPDSREYRELKSKGFLIKESVRKELPAMIRWWNGVSAVLDFSNPGAVDWFVTQLKKLQSKYNIDGFKFDGGDAHFYNGEYKSYMNITPNEHTELFAKIGLQFSLNEYRACWKMGGQALAQRLRDKECSWNDLKKLIPGILSQGLMGYSFTCPDMIGGGEYLTFLNNDKIDGKLVVRSSQVHALMPMMQFSVAPWRVLNKKNLDITLMMAKLHEGMGTYILNLAKHSSVSGEPIVRHLEYEFPHQGFDEVNDQFMLGGKIMVAPVIEQNSYARVVKFPKGKWIDELGKVIVGPCEIEVEANIGRLPYYQLLGEE